MSEMDILRVQNLVKYFPITGGILGKQIAKVHAVDDVTFSVKKGKTLGLVGESGCGKSTLGRTILRLIEPTSGNIFFDGKDITNISQKQLRPLRKEIQIVFQDPFASLNPRMSIREILSEPFEIHNLFPDKQERIHKVLSLLKEVGLSPEAIDRYPHEFSGGQRQRIGIARALSLNPKIIICDEPVSALDVSIQSQILNLMMDLRDKYHLSYIFIAHDLSVIEHISDEVAVMYLGKIVEYTSSENLYKHPIHPYTKALISSIPRHNVVEKREHQVIQGDLPSPIDPPSGCRFHTRCPFAKEICSKQIPELKNLGSEINSHLVACHFSNELKNNEIL
ncbi:ABC transporter ATP-binding protein [Silvanigrella aquatica]|uniref:Peptide ABC transporter substrate-binding protein n=1 Tax=Silvanigrella aquatica TaxID=1915309 RepID=A0A1L4D4A1_9BACT|nr:dipeptide ABC transporter ATP-binding protein [Silvanigrella aquatica]APJ05010.1 peptide ABC transporter substrate-binding protein [Silvanigrella aquatica]